MDTLQLIEAIEARPGMYVDPDSAVSIYFFVQGFLFCRSVHGLRNDQDDVLADGFYGWLRDTHGLEAAATWGDLLSVLAALEQARPIDVFKREFGRFRNACRSQSRIDDEEEDQ